MHRTKKVLVIDDEAHIRRVIEVKLRNAGYDVVIAGDGEDGLRAIEEHQPDVVISDIMMPRLDGRALCERTNAMKATRPFLTVMLTARIDPSERQWMAQLRDTEFMEKPFSPSKLLELVNRYCEG